MEYIEREKAIDYLMEIIDRPNHPEWLWTDEICDSLNTIPAADVRPVVTCADCEHNNHCLTQEFVDDCGKTPLDRNTFFCADGERRSNA